MLKQRLDQISIQTMPRAEYGDDLILVENDDFAKNYKSYEEYNLQDCVVSTSSGIIYKAFYHQDKVGLLKIGHKGLFDKFGELREVLTKQILSQ